MIERVHIRNFRCLEDVEIEFAPLTAFVGPNASGKSAIVDALGSRLHVESRDIWQRRPGLVVQADATIDGAPFARRVGIGQRAKAPWSLLKLTVRPELMKGPRKVLHAPTFATDAGDLVNVFATLTRALKAQVAERLAELIPVYRDVDHRPAGEGDHRLMFQDRWDRSRWYEPSEVSEGTLVLLVFLVLAHLEPPPDVVAIEHPENALHPYLLREVIGMLRDLAHGRLGGKTVQVILTTHSPQVLDFLEPDEVRFVTRDLQSGATQVCRAPIGSGEWRSAFDEYDRSLGEMWLSGSLGAVPGASPTA